MLTHFWSVLVACPRLPFLLPSLCPKERPHLYPSQQKMLCFLFSIFHFPYPIHFPHPFSISYFNMSLNWACYLCKPSDTLWPQSRHFSTLHNTGQAKKTETKRNETKWNWAGQQCKQQQSRDVECRRGQVQTCQAGWQGVARTMRDPSMVDTITTRTVVIKMPCS